MKNILLISFTFLSLNLFSEIKVFEHKYSYKSSLYDDMNSSRVMATYHVRKKIIEQVADFLNQMPAFVVNDKTNGYSFIITKVIALDILKKKWGSGVYSVKAQISINTEKIIFDIKKIINRKSEYDEYLSTDKQILKAYGVVEELNRKIAKNDQNTITKKDKVLYKNAIKIIDAEEFYNDGRAEIRANHFQKAIGFFHRSDKNVHNNPNNFYGIAICYQNLHKIKKAVGYYNKALHLNPNYDNALFNLASISVHDKDYKKAEMYYKRILKHGTKDIVIYRNLASFYSLQENYKKSIYYYLEAIEKCKNIPKQQLSVILWELANAYKNFGDEDAQLKYVKQAAKLGHRKAIDFY